jgi:cell division protein FtsB
VTRYWILKWSLLWLISASFLAVPAYHYWWIENTKAEIAQAHREIDAAHATLKAVDDITLIEETKNK